MALNETKKLQYVVDAGLAARFAGAAAALRMTGSEAVAQAMGEWLDRNKKKAGLR